MLLIDMEMPEHCQECPLKESWVGTTKVISKCRVDGHLIDSDLYFRMFRDAKCPIIQEIPNDATNGDVIKMLFSNIKSWLSIEDNDTIFVNLKFESDWWNAPYERR